MEGFRADLWTKGIVRRVDFAVRFRVHEGLKQREQQTFLNCSVRGLVWNKTFAAAVAFPTPQRSRAASSTPHALAFASVSETSQFCVEQI